jgi:threonine aldolase
LENLQEIAAIAKTYGLATHMDGARIFNASVATGVTPADYANGYDSCWIDFTKGLGGFAGAVLAGSDAFINEAWRIAQQWGGALRQSGVISATALYALDNNVDRLSEDHIRAAVIGKSLKEMPNVKSVLPYETNIIIFEIIENGPSAATVVNRLLHNGIRVGVFGERTVRIVTHLDVDDRSVELLCRELPRALAA